jgi:N-acetylglucosamine kinase-like BadF-type ATPase
MILIADSGSTKTDWRLIDGSKVTSYTTIGFNPYHISSDAIIETLNKSELSLVRSSIKQLFFYGAGCSSDAKKKIIKEPLSVFFTDARVEVEHDMLGAARATCGKNEGMVGILGTGSNSCMYDGSNIIESIPALGYVLGDYGSGVDIGKAFLRMLLLGDLPKAIELDFNQKYNLSIDDILNAVYKEALPNRFLASFSEFVYQHLSNNEMKELVEACFKSFFDTNISKYTNYQIKKLHLIGSVAYAYKGLIENVAINYSITLGKIIKKPIDELVIYHV